MLLRRAQRSQEPAEPAAAGQGSDPKAPLSTGGRTVAAAPPRLAWVANKPAQPCGPAGAPEAACSAGPCLRLPQAPASLGQSAARAALAGHTGLGFDVAPCLSTSSNNEGTRSKPTSAPAAWASQSSTTVSKSASATSAGRDSSSCGAVWRTAGRCRMRAGWKCDEIPIIKSGTIISRDTRTGGNCCGSCAARGRSLGVRQGFPATAVRFQTTR